MKITIETVIDDGTQNAVRRVTVATLQRTGNESPEGGTRRCLGRRSRRVQVRFESQRHDGGHAR